MLEFTQIVAEFLLSEFPDLYSLSVDWNNDVFSIQINARDAVHIRLLFDPTYGFKQEVTRSKVSYVRTRTGSILSEASRALLRKLVIR